MRQIITWETVEEIVNEIYVQICDNKAITKIYGLPRGGLIPAVMLSHKAKLPLITDSSLVDNNTLIVDDISDSGETLKGYTDFTIATLFIRHNTKTTPTIFGEVIMNDDWIVFPWERSDSKQIQDYKVLDN